MYDLIITHHRIKLFYIFCFCLLLSACDKESLWNDPYPYEAKEANARFSVFTERPKHLDPAQSYSEPEWTFIGQIYEPPLQYHYLKRPYELEPLTAEKMPDVYYFNEQGERLADNAPIETVAYSEYWIHLKKGIYYQPHPAFAKDEEEQFRYHHLKNSEARQYKTLSDFKYNDTRELIADDYVYQIKRLAEPSLNSPIFGFMSKYIVGLSELRQQLQSLPTLETERDLRAFELKGVHALDRYTYKIRIKGKYPQFQYWLALPFFSPVPWEAVKFFAQNQFKSQNISIDWYPVGTGAYMLAENNPDRRMTLLRNPNFHEEKYPSIGTKEDEAGGLLKNAGKKLPLIDKVIFSLEKEDIPYWNKFLQGYYDISGISSDNFSSAVRFSVQGNPEVSGLLKDKGIRLRTEVSTGIWFWGFNMLDETVGGNSLRAKNLRKAIAAALDVEEFISIFLNDRGRLAIGPIPPDLFGYSAQTYSKWNLEEAQAFLKKEGLIGSSIYFDAVATGDPDEIAIHTWLSSQFEKLGLNLIIRSSDFNRFQEKIRQGGAQMYFWGWSSDYPDPENFLFLLYGPNGSAHFGGENTSNYSNPKFDALFEKMRVLKDGEERLALIRQMINILNEELPWIYGFYPKSFALYHAWTDPSKPSGLVHNSLKYVSVNPALRAEQQENWNKPILWPTWIIVLILLLMILPAILFYFKKLYSKKEFF